MTPTTTDWLFSASVDAP